MGIHTTLPSDLQGVDVIVVGGTRHSRLHYRVETRGRGSKAVYSGRREGSDNYNVPSVIHPVLWQGNYAPEDPRVFFHRAVKEEQLADRESLVEVDDTLGGGLSVSQMMYMRGQRCDYDSWNTRGWTADDLWPYLRKVTLPRAKEAFRGILRD
ncbi:hypothetical protein DL767_008700 [Monosporascus sp. MG133]|nr:hypothetical protein DL767_008700 [Monosporascus sp. MG133]